MSACENVLNTDFAGLCLWQAIKAGNKDAVQLLITYFPETKHYRDEQGLNPVLYAAQERQVVIFQLLCEEGCESCATSKEGRRARDIISTKTPDGQAMLKVLLEYESKNAQAPVNERETERASLASQGWTPVEVAVFQQDIHTLKAAKAEEINRVGKDGRTPLMVAYKQGKANLLTRLFRIVT